MSAIVVFMTDADIIKRLGVEAIVAALQPTNKGVTPEAIRKWRARAIPWKYRASLLELAEKQGARLPKRFLTERRAAA